MSGQATQHPQTDVRRLRGRTESSNRSMPQAAHSGTLHRTRSRPTPRKTAEAQCDQAAGITGSLRIAYEMFTDFGMEAFAERASIELRATGEHARRRTVDALRQLTPAGGRDLAPGTAGKHEPRDCRSTVHQPEHGRVPLAQGVPKTRSEIADRPGSSDGVVDVRGRRAPLRSADRSASTQRPRHEAADSQECSAERRPFRPERRRSASPEPPDTAAPD
jgi:hypothetical protein